MSNKSTEYKINNSVLKAYDIRGTVNKDLFIQDAYNIGRGIATVLYRKYGDGDKKVIVGYDGRISSPEMFKQLTNGLIDAGIDVVSIGLCTTPMIAYANIVQNADASVMITASHNPASDNGFKIATRGNEPFFGESIKGFGEIINRGEFYVFNKDKKGSLTQINITNEYVDRLLQDITDPKPLKVVWDCGNGVASVSLLEIIKKLPGEHITLYCDIDGNFPNHEPDPSVSKNLSELQKKVIETNADLGIAFDGDADRMTAIDGQGRIIENDRLLVIFARDVLSRNPDSYVILEVKSSMLAVKAIRDAGGRPIMYKTGHSSIKQKMKEIGALVAGEISGHFYWKEKFFGFDDGVYSAVRLLDILARKSETLAQLNDSVPVGFTIEEIKIYANREDIDNTMQNLAVRLKEENADILDIDGLRVNRKQGWWLIRSSQTSNAFTIKAEGKNQEDLQVMIAELDSYLKQASDYKIELPKD